MSFHRVRPAQGNRVLHHPGLRPVDVDRHPVLGLVLDQHRRFPRPRLPRPTHRPGDDDDERGSEGVPPTRLLYQGILILISRHYVLMRGIENSAVNSVPRIKI